jgi:hypothetical protein
MMLRPASLSRGRTLVFPITFSNQNSEANQCKVGAAAEPSQKATPAKLAGGISLYVLSLRKRPIPPIGIVYEIVVEPDFSDWHEA